MYLAGLQANDAILIRLKSLIMNLHTKPIYWGDIENVEIQNAKKGVQDKTH